MPCPYAGNAPTAPTNDCIPREQLSDGHLEGVFQRAYIQDALTQVPLAFREVVVLRDIQQLTYDEIAKITGLPMGTVKSRINRGRKKLQALLKEIYHD